MSEMIERVTKAIYDSMDITDGLDIISAEIYAAAAVRAMRYPTGAMVDAGNIMVYSDELACGINALASDDGGLTSNDCWQRMIDEALK